MRPRVRKLNLIITVTIVALFIIQPLSTTLSARAMSPASPGKCSQSPIVLIPDIVTILSPVVTNITSTSCQVSGQMRVQLAGNDVQNIPVTGRVDAYNHFVSSSIGYFELAVAGLTVKASTSRFDNPSGKPTLTLQSPKIKIPDDWGGLEANTNQAFTIDADGLKGFHFSLPTITSGKFSLDLTAAFGWDSTNGYYYISAQGDLKLPDFGKTEDCSITVAVTLYVNLVGNVVMKIYTPSGAQVASLAADRSEIPLPSGHSKLKPASMPLHSSYLPLPESTPKEVVVQLLNPAPAAAEEAQPSGSLQATASLQATGSLQDIFDAEPGPAEPLPVLTSSAPAGPDAPALAWQGLIASVGYQCSGKGIPIGTTGFELTGVSGTLTLMPYEQSVSLAVVFDSTAKLLDKPLLTIDADASFQWSPEFAASLGGAVTILSTWHAGGAEISIGETDGLRLTVWYQTQVIWGDMALHAWNTDVSSCTAWQTVCYQHAGLPDTCTSTCGNYVVKTKFHFTGSAACQVGVRAGTILDTPGVPYMCNWRICKKWWIKYPCFSWCSVSVKIPPTTIPLAGASTQFGEFTGGRWGLKGTVSFLGFSIGFYFDNTGNTGTIHFGNVSSYQLVNGQQIQAAYQAYQAATLQNGPQAAYPGDDTFRFPSPDQVDILFDLPLPDQFPAPLGVTDEITHVQVITQTDTLFSVKADVPLRVTLTTPDQIDITPDNYDQSPDGYVVDYNWMTDTERISQQSSGSEGRWRFIPASNVPTLETVNVQLDAGDVFTSSVSELQVMDFITIPVGTHAVQVWPLNGNWPTLSTAFNVITGTDYTVMTIGNDVAELRVLADDNHAPSPGSGLLRVVDLADNASSIDLTMPVGSVQGLGYTVSSTLEVPAGTYSTTLASPDFPPGLTAILTQTGSVLYGDQVARAGDVNGDGYADVLVADNAYNSDQGRVDLYLGSPAGLQKTASWIATGENMGDHFGISIAAAGDVNNDGYDDVLVGAYDYTIAPEDQPGKAYLYYGSPNGLGLTPAWSAVGENGGDQFGVSVAGAGDVNNDGFADIIIGANQYPASSFYGKAYLYYGSSAGPVPSLPGGIGTAWAVAGANYGDEFGVSVASAGDVNHDGFADVIVGAGGYSDAQGQAYLYLGSATGLTTTASWFATGLNGSDEFGYAVAGVGDVNHDNYDDVVIGAYGYPAGANQGRASLYLGSSTGLSTSESWSAVGQNAGDYFGVSVSGAGDVNGDGYADFLVGAYQYPVGIAQGQAALFTGSARGPYRFGEWSTTDSLPQARYLHTATLLPDGRVLIAGGLGATGPLSSAYLYDSQGMGRVQVDNLHMARYAATATLLPDGRVLVAGGRDANGDYLASAEIFNPAAGHWTLTGNMNETRSAQTATLLPDGRVLVAGGCCISGNYLASAELYDPTTGTWSLTGSLATPRRDHTATRLPDGKVLVVGGWNNNQPLASAELYDPATGSWSATGDLGTARSLHTATLLPGGMVLVAGGYSAAAIASAELYDPAQGTWSATGPLNVARGSHTATLLLNGDVLVVGGLGTGGVLNSAELYDPEAGSWTQTGIMKNYSRDHTATRLLNGRVLVVAGHDDSMILDAAEMYNLPWTATGVSEGDQFGLAVAGVGDVNGDQYSDLLFGARGANAAYLYNGSFGLSPTNVTLQDGEVSTLFLSRIAGSPDPLVFLQTSDALYKVITTTQYVVDQARTGPWSLNLYGDTLEADLQVSVMAAPNPPVLDQLTVDASDLANTLVSYRLLSDVRPVSIRMFANDGPITGTVTFTNTEGIAETREIALYQGIEVADLSLNEDLGPKGAVVTTTVDLSSLESGDYKLWVRAEDGISSPVQGYVWGTSTYASGKLPTAWNRVQVASARYDELKQAEGAANIVIDHTSTFEPNFTTTVTPTISPEGLAVAFTPYDHPDVDGYLLEVSELGVTHVITTGNKVYYHTDANGDPVGDPIHYATFKGLSPEHTYALRIAALDLDHDLTSWSQEFTYTVPIGDFSLKALNASIQVAPGQLVFTATLVLTMTEDLFSDVSLSLDSYFLPPGVTYQVSTYQVAGGSRSPVALSNGIIPSPLRLPGNQSGWLPDNATSGAATGGDITVLVQLTIAVPTDLPAAVYLLPIVAYSGELEKRTEIRLAVGTPEYTVYDPASGTPLVLHGVLPLPSCATSVDLTVPVGAFSQKVYIGFVQGTSNVADWFGSRFGGSHFFVAALDYNSQLPVEPAVPLILNLGYDPACFPGALEYGLYLRSLANWTEWSTAGLACTTDPANHTLTCYLGRIGEFALFEPYALYLPVTEVRK